MSTVVTDRRLWLDANGRCVEDGDPRAAFLWHPVGAVVTASEAEAVGYRPAGAAPQEAPAPKPGRKPGNHKSRKPKDAK